MQNTQEIITALQAQFDSIQTRIAAIDKEAAATAAQYREQRSKVAAEAAPLARALAALGVKVSLPGVSTPNGTGRKFVMSESAKQNIREGLKRAREAKLAAAQAATTPKPEQEPLAPKAEQPEPLAASDDTTGRLRVIRKSDGLFVAGEGRMIPVDSYEEAERIILELYGPADTTVKSGDAKKAPAKKAPAKKAGGRG